MQHLLCITCGVSLGYITFGLSPAVHHLRQCIDCGGAHQLCITCSASPVVYHLRCITWVHHIQLITCSASPRVVDHQRQCINCGSASPAVHYLCFITCGASSTMHHLRCITWMTSHAVHQRLCIITHLILTQHVGPYTTSLSC